jgi:hypothetical protein
VDGHNPPEGPISQHQAVCVLTARDMDLLDGACENPHAHRADPRVFANEKGCPAETVHRNREAEGGGQLLEWTRAGKWHARLEAQHNLGRAAEVAPDLFQTPARERAGHRDSQGRRPGPVRHYRRTAAMVAAVAGPGMGG